MNQKTITDAQTLLKITPLTAKTTGPIKPPTKIRIALILRGISFINDYYHHHSQAYVNIDYRKSLQNYKDMIYENNDVDVFMHTYDSPGFNKDEWVNSFCTKDYSLDSPYIDTLGHNFQKKCHSLIYSLQRALGTFDKSGKNPFLYDYIIVTRYDLFFKKKISELLLDSSKFMVSCMTEQPHLSDDNFFIFHPKFYKDFRKIIMTFDLVKYDMLHYIYELLIETIGKNNIKMLIDGNYAICKGTPLYDIIRSNILNFE